LDELAERSKLVETSLHDPNTILRSINSNTDEKGDARRI
jgi:hypothetical protein